MPFALLEFSSTKSGMKMLYIDAFSIDMKCMPIRSLICLQNLKCGAV